MKLKKINAVITLLMILLVLDHVVFMGAYFWGFRPYSAEVSPIAIAFVALFVIHAVISTCILFFGKSSSEKLYPKLNAQTIEQRITALLLIVLIHAHVADKTLFAAGGSVRLFIPELLLILTLMAHLGTSTDRAFITLGVEKKWPAIVARILVLIANLFGLAGLVKFCFFA